MTIPQWLEKARKMLRQKYFGAKTTDILTNGEQMRIELEQGGMDCSLQDLYGLNISFREDGRCRDMRKIVSRTEAAKMLNTTPQVLKMIFDIGDGPNCCLYLRDSSGRVCYYFEKDIKAFANTMERDGAALPIGLAEASKLLGVSIYKVKKITGCGWLGGFLIDGVWHFRPENIKKYMEREKKIAQLREEESKKPQECAEPPENVDELCAALGEKGINAFIMRTEGGRNIPVCMAKEVYKAMAKPCQCRQGKLTD